MKRLIASILLVWMGLASSAAVVRAADDLAYTRKEDVIYGRKFGMALTMDVVTPKKNANGLAVIWVVSGGWFSDHGNINAGSLKLFTGPFLDRGYTVFAVCHGSQPRFTIPEAIADMKRSVRFIRYHAKEYNIDPERICVIGGSAGGHLSLMMGTTGDDGETKSKDLVDRTSSRVQAVACFFPPTDFLNYGEKGNVALGRSTLRGFKAPFDFIEFDNKTNSFVRVTDEEKILKIGKEISPYYQVTSRSAPTLIIHGDKDKLVPIQQAQIIVEKLKEAGVAAELFTKEGGDHGWGGLDKDVAKLADWCDKHLKENKK